MKKITAIFALLIILCTTVAYAGSVPEDLRASDDAEVFFAKVIFYNPLGDTIKIKPTKIIKGDVVAGETVEYAEPSPVGGIVPIIGKVYLFAYYDEVNPTYIFKTTTEDTKTLKLEGIGGMAMWKRFEEYLNNGDYDSVDSENVQSAEIVEKSPPVESYIVPVAAAVLIGIFAAAVVTVKKKRKNK